jgi:hypothetical protein
VSTTARGARAAPKPIVEAADAKGAPAPKPIVEAADERPSSLGDLADRTQQAIDDAIDRGDDSAEVPHAELEELEDGSFVRKVSTKRIPVYPSRAEMIEKARDPDLRDQNGVLHERVYVTDSGAKVYDDAAIAMPLRQQRIRSAPAASRIPRGHTRSRTRESHRDRSGQRRSPSRARAPDDDSGPSSEPPPPPLPLPLTIAGPAGGDDDGAVGAALLSILTRRHPAVRWELAP